MSEVQCDDKTCLCHLGCNLWSVLIVLTYFCDLGHGIEFVFGPRL